MQDKIEPDHNHINLYKPANLTRLSRMALHVNTFRSDVPVDKIYEVAAVLNDSIENDRTMSRTALEQAVNEAVREVLG